MTLTARQQAMRRTGIGASEIAAVAGESPWGTPFSIWKAKVMGDEVPETNAMRFGNYAEQGVADWYAAETGAKLIKSRTRRHPVHRWMIATPDRIRLEADRPARLVQIKTVGSKTADHWGQDRPDAIPNYTLLQVTQEMEVTGLETCDVAALFLNTRELRIYTVQRDQRLVEAIVGIGSEFWSRYIVSGQVPPIDISEAASRYLRERYPLPKRAELLPATSEVEALAREYAAAHAEIAAAEKRKELAKNRLCELIGDETGFESEGVKVTWKADSRGKTAWKAVAEELQAPPELIEKHRGTPERKIYCRVKGIADTATE